MRNIIILATSYIVVHLPMAFTNIVIFPTILRYVELVSVQFSYDFFFIVGLLWWVQKGKNFGQKSTYSQEIILVFRCQVQFCILLFSCPPVKVYKKVVKFSFTKQKIFWVLVFSFMYLVSVDPMDRSVVTKYFFNSHKFNAD